MAETEPTAPGPEVERPRVLRRSREDRVIAGVCAGLGRYFGIDPVLLRIAFVVAIVGNVRVFEDEEGGFGVEREAGPGLDGRVPVLVLVLSVGLGEVEVRRG